MIQQKEVLHIGTLRRPHGKNGELQCVTENDYWYDADADFAVLMLDGILVPFRVTDWREKGDDTLVLRLQGVDTEEHAARLVNAKVYMLRRDLAEETEQMLTWQDLAGYEVLNAEGETQGRVLAVNESTINTLLEMEDGRLLPIHEDLIVRIDETERRMVLDLPEGL